MTRVEQLGNLPITGNIRLHHIYVSDVDGDMTTFSVWSEQSKGKSATGNYHVTLPDPDGVIAAKVSNHNRVHNGVSVPEPELPEELREIPPDTHMVD